MKVIKRKPSQPGPPPGPPPRPGLQWNGVSHRWIRPDTGAEWTAGGISIPPGLTDVVTFDDPNSELQATGYDSKGRKKYLYSVKHKTKVSASKFARVKALGKALPRLKVRLARDLGRVEEATVLELIRVTGFRVGSDRDTQAAVKAYGASTLLARHVKLEAKQATIDFVGKKGVVNHKVVTDPTLVAMLTRRMRGKKSDGRLFNTDKAKVLGYLRAVTGKHFNTKDLRTWLGTNTAQQVMATMPVPVSAAEYKARRKEVGDLVAGVLGNTGGVALSSYIQPEVFAPWESALANKALKKAVEDGFNVWEDVDYDETVNWEEVPESVGEDPDDSEEV